MAKSLFLLTDPQLAALPSLQLTGEAAKRSGAAIGADPRITLVTSGSCVAAAVARWGSEAALRAEAGARLERARESFDARSAAARADASKETKFPSGPRPGKEQCSFPHLNQANGLFTHDPVYGLSRCPPRR